jgi:hypothetical protein
MEYNISIIRIIIKCIFILYIFGSTMYVNTFHYISNQTLKSLPLTNAKHRVIKNGGSVFQ